MIPEHATIETIIAKKEQQLRDWFTRGKDPIAKLIDGLDIGWGGVQRWATGQIPPLEGLHLDIACGYATFLAQLGWRFPKVDLVGLNIDFVGPHRLARPLLAEAGVKATLIQADARRIPFADAHFPSISCFLGLQDIEIGFGEEGVKETLTDAIRVLQPGGVLILLDEFPFSRFVDLLTDLSIEIIRQAEKSLDVHWTAKVAERAIECYASGWVTQARPDRETEKEKIYQEALDHYREDVEQQLGEKGHYVPFGSVHMILGRKIPTKIQWNQTKGD
jgi:ubiquinone/menaquinone biosynthesis C-methylase UbiE